MKKKLFCWLIYFTGIWSFWKVRNKNKVAVLTIHGVSDKNSGAQWQPLRSYLSTDELDNHLSRIKKHYNFVSIEKAARMIRGEEPIQKNCVTVTFDDGYLNNIELAFPVLKKHGVPMTLFAATGHIEREEPFWFDRLDYAVQHNIDGQHEEDFDGQKLTFDMSDRVVGKATLVKSIRTILQLSPDDYVLVPKAIEFIERIESIKGKSLLDIIDTDINAALASTETLAEFAKDDLVTIGSHTKNHVRLHSQPAEKVENELTLSKDMLEDLLGERCDWFCFPNGSTTKEAADITDKVGFLASFTTKEGLASVGDYPYLLNRLNFPINVPPEYLMCHIAGVFPLFKKS